MSTLYNKKFIEYTPFNKNNIQKVNINIHSSEYVFTEMLNAINNKTPFNIIRMGDGEAGFIKYFLNGIKPSFLTKQWKNQFGLSNFSDTELKNIGKDLITVAEEANYLGISIWGENNILENWNVRQFLNRKNNFCSNWFNMEWVVTGCIHTLVNQYNVSILHNDAFNVSNSIHENFGNDPRFLKNKNDIGFFILNGNFEKAEIFIKNTSYDVYLVSGGPFGKIWMYNMSKKYNKVMIDVGHAVTRCYINY